MRTAVERVTPHDAAHYLKTANTSNRRIRPRAVAIYAAAMKAGEWKLIPDGIIFDRGGQLIQGQHRLAAVVESDTAVDFVVTRGVDAEIYDVLDRGAPRTGADILRRHGISNAKDVHSTAVLLLRYAKYPNRAWGGGTRGGDVAHHEIEGYALDNADELCQWMAVAERARSAARSEGVLIPPSILAALGVTSTAAGWGREACEGFLRLVGTGECERSHPARALRRFAVSLPAGGQRQQRLFAGSIRAFNAYTKSTPLTVIRWNVESLPMPQVVAAREIQAGVA